VTLDQTHTYLPREYRLESNFSTDVGLSVTGDWVRKSSPASVSVSDNTLSDRLHMRSNSIVDPIDAGNDETEANKTKKCGNF
jgi:hypothetical protein